MKVASITVMAMIQGLTPRCQSMMGEAVAGGCSMMGTGLLLGVQGLHLAGTEWARSARDWL
jgi:hypothetical protein